MNSEKNTILFQEQYRPRFHFTPTRNWMNDPNGLLFYKGKYHLFFQHNPNGDLWGDMSWGHAVSNDLLTWEELPVAISWGENYGIFSGSAVVDYTNSSGFGTIENPAMVAIFTKHMNDGSNQSQCLAYSLDEGLTWHHYEGNPVLDLSMQDFRDPKVWRDEANNRWLMAVVKPKEFKVSFFASINLKEWALLSEFGDQGAIGGCWECPDLFPLTTDSGITKWVLLVSINPGGPNGGSATQYFIGDFDGTTFTADDKEIRWIDHGFDNYAGVTFNDAPDKKRIFIGWMSNWEYANKVPTSPWRSAMTIPRELSLATINNTFTLTQKPIHTYSQNQFVVTFDELEDSEIVLENPENQKVVIAYSPSKKILTFDRSGAWIPESPMTTHTMDVTDPAVILIVDRSGIEIFADSGSAVMTNLTLLDQATVITSAKVTLKTL